MLDSFNAILTPMLMLFLCIVIGFVLGKTKIMSDDSAKTVANLETWVFCPALSFITMAKCFTAETLTTHAENMSFALVLLAIAMPIGILLARLLIKTPCYERNIYTYVLIFGNYSYLGEPLVREIFGEQMFSNFKLFCLPITIVVFMWGVGLFIPKGNGKGGSLKAFLNPTTIGLFLGMATGITGLGGMLPAFLTGTLNSLSNCMGPVGMILLGLTISSYNVKEILLEKKLYIATILRLIILPAVIIPALFGIKELANLVLNLSISNEVLTYAFFIVSTPHGMNTIVFPKSYGGDPRPGAGLALISHVLCIVTIPLLFALMKLLFP